MFITMYALNTVVYAYVYVCVFLCICVIPFSNSDIILYTFDVFKKIFAFNFYKSHLSIH